MGILSHPRGLTSHFLKLRVGFVKFCKNCHFHVTLPAVRVIISGCMGGKFIQVAVSTDNFTSTLTLVYFSQIESNFCVLSVKLSLSHEFTCSYSLYLVDFWCQLRSSVIMHISAWDDLNSVITFYTAWLVSFSDFGFGWWQFTFNLTCA